MVDKRWNFGTLTPDEPRCLGVLLEQCPVPQLRCHQCWFEGKMMQMPFRYSKFLQFCRICGKEMTAVAESGSGLPFGFQRDAVCGSKCADEFNKRQWESLSGIQQDFDTQRTMFHPKEKN